MASKWVYIGTTALAFVFATFSAPRTWAGKPQDRVVSGSLEDFNRARSMICKVHPGQLDEAKEICRAAGLTVVEEIKSRDLLGCKWTPRTKLDRRTLTTLVKSRKFRYIEPGIAPRKLGLK